jgi:hypothetical protein
MIMVELCRTSSRGRDRDMGNAKETKATGMEGEVSECKHDKARGWIAI